MDLARAVGETQRLEQPLLHILGQRLVAMVMVQRDRAAQGVDDDAAVVARRHVAVNLRAQFGFEIPSM